MVQIYKSEIVDLLRADDEPIRPLHLEFCADGRVLIQNVHFHRARKFLYESGEEELNSILNKGLDNRLMRSTEANQASSRSHLLFALLFSHTVEGKRMKGKIMFVDLAGSERLANLGFTLFLYEEAMFINESLAVFGRLIWKLSKNIMPTD